MPGINLVRSFGEEVALGMQRISEARTALAGLVDDAAKADDAAHAIASGSTWDDPFDAILELAETGNRGLWDGWTKAEAAHSIFSRAIARHPGGEGVVELHRAAALVEQASGDLGNWVATGGRGATLTQVEAVVGTQLDQAREAAQLALSRA